jgi:L-ascorbate metabolism protein UlaG (beta-lactamase superfamily)
MPRLYDAVVTSDGPPLDRVVPAGDDGSDGPADSGLRLTWLGHASVMIELGAVKVLTDPALTHRVAHLRRHHVVDVATIGTPDVVLISHVHMDHLHIPSLRMFGRDVPLVVPIGAAAMLRRRGFRRVTETAAGRTTHVGRLTIETVPAVHSGRRGPHSRIAVDAVGYVLRAAEGSVYFPGDTDLFTEMASLGNIDAALLPIWGWGPTLGEGHLDPARAVRATELVQPRIVVPIHWGTYSPVRFGRGAPSWLDDPVHQFETDLDGVGAGDILRVLDPGRGLVVPYPAELGTATEPCGEGSSERASIRCANEW